MCGSVHFNACELGHMGSALGSALQVPHWLRPCRAPLASLPGCAAACGQAAGQMCEIQPQRNKSLFSIICCNLFHLAGFSQFSAEGMA